MKTVAADLNTRDLRRRAESRLLKTRRDVERMSREEVQKLIYELQVHEVELHMQNDELVRAQEELAAAADRYSLLYESAPCAYLTLSMSGGILEANMAAAALLNVEKSRLRRWQFTSFIRAESQDAFYLFCKQMKRSRQTHSVELNLRIAKRDRCVVQATGLHVLAGVESEFRIALIDISERKEAQIRQEQSERNLSDFFDQAPLGIQWVDAEGVIFRANGAQLEMQGYSAEEYLGRRIDDFAPDADAIAELLRRLRRREVIHNFHAVVRHRDGRMLEVLIDAAPHAHREKGVYFSLFTRDITYRRNLEQEILEISEREQKRIAQDLHDDLGQILTATLYTAGLLQKRLETELPRGGKEAAKVLELLDVALSRVRSMSRGLHPVRPEPNGLISALEELARQTSGVFHRNCLFNCPEPIDVRDNNVATHLYRLAQEAVTNAIKHGDAGRIEIALHQDSDRMILKISDDGRGFVPRDSGMGLKIMEYRASVVKGRWNIAADPEGGTVVTCSIRRTKSAPRKKKASP